jgi:amino acid transporter
MWIARLTAFAANCNLLVTYLSFFLPAASQPLWRAIIIIAVVVTLTIVNVIGVRDAAIASNVFTIGKLLPIILFIGIGIFFINPANFSFDSPPQYGAFSSSVLSLIYAFTGFEMAVIPAGEVRDPRRNLPMAILTAMAIVALVYILIQIVCIGTLPKLATSERPLSDAFGSFSGAKGAAIISAGALISITGNLIVLILAASRLPFAMAERGELPRALAATHKRFRTPAVAILATASVMLALTLSSGFVYALTISAIARLLAYSATCAALPALRAKKDAPEAMFKAPAGVAVSALSLVLAIWLLSNTSWQEARDSAIAAAAGLAIYLAYRFASNKRPQN